MFGLPNIDLSLGVMPRGRGRGPHRNSPSVVENIGDHNPTGASLVGSGAMEQLFERLLLALSGSSTNYSVDHAKWHEAYTFSGAFDLGDA